MARTTLFTHIGIGQAKVERVVSNQASARVGKNTRKGEHFLAEPEGVLSVGKQGGAIASPRSNHPHLLRLLSPQPRLPDPALQSSQHLGRTPSSSTAVSRRQFLGRQVVANRSEEANQVAGLFDDGCRFRLQGAREEGR